MMDCSEDERPYGMEGRMAGLPNDMHEKHQRQPGLLWPLPASPLVEYSALLTTFSTSPSYSPLTTFEFSPPAAAQLGSPQLSYELAWPNHVQVPEQLPVQSGSDKAGDQASEPCLQPLATTSPSLLARRTTSKSHARPLSTSIRHRWLDSARRRREAALIARLDAFLSGTVVRTSSQHPPLPTHDAPHSSTTQLTAGAQSRSCLSVLRATVDTLHQLNSVAEQLRATFEANARLLRPISLHHINPARSAESAGQSTAQARITSVGASSGWSVQRVMSSLAPPMSTEQAVYRRGFQSASVGLLVLDTTSGCCVDANEYWLAQTGWTHSQVLHRLLIAPYEVLMRHRPNEGSFTSPCARSHLQHQNLRYTDNRPLIKHQQAAQTRSVSQGSSASAAPSTAGMLAEPVEQFPKSVRLLQQLYLGERDSVALLWRLCMADGVVREQRQLAWVSRRQRLVNDIGETGWRPQYLVMAAAFGAPVTLDYKQASKERV